MTDISKITDEELEMLQRRIDDPDWDISQQNDVWELLPSLLKAVALNNKTMCAYCGFVHEDKTNMAEIVDHIMKCEKRPERKLLDKAFEIEDRLYQRIIHLTEHGYQPDTCEECKEISIVLSVYKDGVKEDVIPKETFQESFQDAVQNDPDMSAEQKAYWLSPADQDRLDNGEALDIARGSAE